MTLKFIGNPGMPYKKVNSDGASITIQTDGKILVLPTGNSAVLPSWNRETLNLNRLTISESPFGGLKGEGSPDYAVGTLYTPTTGVALSDKDGNNSNIVLTAGKLKEVSCLSIDTTAKTITEEFIIKNSALENTATTIDSCDDISHADGFSTGTGTITLDTVEKIAGTGSFYFSGTASSVGTFLGRINCADIAVGTNQFFTFYVKSSHTGAFRFTARTADGYYSWNGTFNTTAGSWQKFVLPILSCPNRTGTSTTITFMELGYYANAPLINSACHFWIDSVKMDVSKRVEVEVSTTDRLAPLGLALSSYSGSAYAEVGRYNLDSGYSVISATAANMKLLDAKTFDSVYGTGEGWRIFPKGVANATSAGSTSSMVFSANKGAKYRIGLYVDLPPSDNDRTAINKVRLKLVMTYADDSGSVPVLLNSANPITTPTYDGSGQGIHPSVVYFADGWHGYKYWMAMTPYPNGNDEYENPSIIASNDGATFEVPAGLTNPIYPAPPAGHNNDTELIYDSVADKLRVYWLDCRRAIECVGFETETWYDHQYLMYMETPDGVNWSAAAISIDWNLAIGDRFILSPAIAKVGNVWKLYYIDASGSRPIFMRESADALTWGAEQAVIMNVTSAVLPWHLEVKYISELNQYWLVYCMYGTSADIYFAVGTDGLNFNRYPRKFIAKGNSTAAWDATLYRTSFIYIPETNTVEVWYSTYNPTSAVRRTGHISIDKDFMFSKLETPLTNYGATSYEFEDSTNASYGLQNISKPWIALYDPVKNFMDFYLFTHRPKNLIRKRDDTGNIYELVLYPGNGSIYHGQITYPNLAADTGGTLIPDCLKDAVQGSVTNLLKSLGMII